MMYSLLFVLLAVASARGEYSSAKINVKDAPYQDSISMDVGDGENSIQLECSVTTDTWTVIGGVYVVLQKKQDEEFMDVVDQTKNTRAPFTATTRFSAEEASSSGSISANITISFVATISKLETRDSGHYRCVYTKGGTILAFSATTMFEVKSPPSSVVLSSSSASSVPSNVTMTENIDNDSEYQKRFNWEVSGQVHVLCQVNGGNPAPQVTITRNNGESMSPDVQPTVTWEGTKGLKTPTTSVIATVSNYNPKSGDKKVVCTAVVGDHTKMQRAKVSFGSQLDVTCPPKVQAELDKNDVIVECRVDSTADLNKAALKKGQGFNQEGICNEGDKDSYTTVRQGLFCRYEMVSPERYRFFMKFSNVDSEDYGDYELFFDNGEMQASTTVSVEKKKTGATTGVSGLIPSVALLLMSLFLAL